MPSKDRMAGDPDFVHRHTFQLKLLTEGESEESVEWFDVQVHSAHADARTALVNYLRREFPAVKNVPENKEGVFSLQDHLLPEAVMERRYRVKPR